MDIPRPKSDRLPHTARIQWSFFGFLAGAFAGLSIGCQHSLPYGIVAAIILGTVLAADGLRVAETAS